MGTPLDLPDWIATIAQSDSPSVLYDNGAAVLNPFFVIPSMDTSQWTSLEVYAGGVASTTNDVIQVDVLWRQGLAPVAEDQWVLWGSRSAVLDGFACFASMPCRGNTALITLTSLVNGTTVAAVVIGSRRQVPALRVGSSINASAPNLIAVATQATTAGQTFTYRVGPVNNRLRLHLIAGGGQTHNYVLFAQVATPNGPVEVQVANGSAVSGTPADLTDMLMPGCSLRLTVTNAGAAGSFVLAVTGD